MGSLSLSLKTLSFVGFKVDVLEFSRRIGFLFHAAEAILLGFQHYLVMLGTTVIIPSALVPQMGGGFVRTHEFFPVKFPFLAPDCADPCPLWSP